MSPGPWLTTDTLREAAQMRIDGASFGSIAETLQLTSRKTAFSAVSRAVRIGLVKADDLPAPRSKPEETAKRGLGKGARRAPVLAYDVPDVDPRWRSRSACKGTDPEDWFPTSDTWDQGTGPERAAELVAFCRSACPVVAECLADALASGDDWAIRGGTTPDERRAMQHESRRTA